MKKAIKGVAAVGFSLFFASMLLSCDGSGEDTANIVLEATGADVVLGGTIKTHKTDKRAYFWSRSSAGEAYGESAVVEGIVYEGGKIYAAGAVVVGNKYRAAYWVDNSIKILDLQTTNRPSAEYASSIAYSNGKIFLGGYYEVSSGPKACFWEIDPAIASTVTQEEILMGSPSGIVFVDLAQGNNFNSRVYGIAVNGNTVYACGIKDSNNMKKACYWTNSNRTGSNSCADLNNANSAYAYAITVSGSDVYTAGIVSTSADSFKAVYWKNSTTATAISTVNSIPYAIAVSGGTVYTAGFEINQDSKAAACYWADTTKTDLSDSAVTSAANAICVQGGTVYTAGYAYLEDSAKSEAVFWSDTAMKVVGGSDYGAEIKCMSLMQ